MIDRADVELRLPADGAWVSVLRTTTAGLAARLDFTLDDIEDLRIAVGEASAMVLEQADPGADLWARFYLAPAELRIAVSVPSHEPFAPDRNGFAWQVLSALTTGAEAESADGHLTVSLTMHSGADS